MKKGTYKASTQMDGSVMFRVDGVPHTIRKGADIDVVIKSERIKVQYPEKFMTFTFQSESVAKEAKKEIKKDTKPKAAPKAETKKVEAKKAETKKVEAEEEPKAEEKEAPKAEAKKAPARGRKKSVKIETEEK
jgi:hypothetical protein